MAGRASKKNPSKKASVPRKRDDYRGVTHEGRMANIIGSRAGQHRQFAEKDFKKFTELRGKNNRLNNSSGFNDLLADFAKTDADDNFREAKKQRNRAKKYGQTNSLLRKVADESRGF